MGLLTAPTVKKVPISQIQDERCTHDAHMGLVMKDAHTHTRLTALFPGLPR